MDKFCPEELEWVIVAGDVENGNKDFFRLTNWIQVLTGRHGQKPS